MLIKLLAISEQYAKEQEDWPEFKPYEAGVKRGKIWQAPEVVKPKPAHDDIAVELDLDDESEKALQKATPAELVDFAGSCPKLLSEAGDRLASDNEKCLVSVRFQSSRGQS